jgi:CHAT domain
MVPVLAIGLLGASLFLRQRRLAEAPAPSPPEESLDVELSGCAAVVTGAVCAGTDGFDSALPLASGGKFTPGDILALRTSPTYVLLFGCETGRESAEGTLGDLGLAHAFLAAGARSVVASARVVDDGLSRDLARELYARIAREPDGDLPRALRDAEIALRKKGASSDWAAFRALVP